MLNEYRVCPMCGCNSAYAAGLYGASCGDEVVVDFVCCYCGCEFKDRIPSAKEAKQEKEAPTMQVSYNGFTGELARLELVAGSYDVEVYDSEKDVAYAFEDIDLDKLKFMGGAVSFGG